MSKIKYYLFGAMCFIASFLGLICISFNAPKSALLVLMCWGISGLILLVIALIYDVLKAHKL